MLWNLSHFLRNALTLLWWNCTLITSRVKRLIWDMQVLIQWYHDDRGFSSWHAKKGEKRKTSEEFVSKSCWVCAVSFPAVWTSHTGQTGCMTGFSPSRHSRAWTVCISAGQNGARLMKMAREEIGLKPRSKVIFCHAQQDFDTISSEVFLFSPYFACQGKPLLSGYLSGFWKVQNWIVFFSWSLKRSKSRKGILESLISKVILIRSSLALSVLINSSSKSLGPVQTTIRSSINLLYSWRY